MKLDIKGISIKNFLSVGQKWLDVDFRQGLFRVTGENQDTGSRNGVGKSTIFIDAVMFGLFGKPVRDINLPDIPNTINNGKGCEVKIKFSIGNDEYMIHRGINPGFLLLHKNGTELGQDSAKKFTQKKIDEIIGSSFKTFSHLLIMSNSYSTPFLDLDTNSKRAILEDILGVSIFGKMNDQLTKETKDLNTEYKMVSKEYDILSSNLKSMKANIKKLLSKSKAFKEDKETKINSLNEKIELVENEIKKCEKSKDIVKVNESIDKLVEKRNKLSEEKESISVNVKVLEKEIKTANKTLKELGKNPTCPVCGTETNSDHVQKHVAELNSTIDDNTKSVEDAEEKELKLQTESNELTEKITELRNEVINIEKNSVKLSSLNEKMETLKERLENAENQTNNFEEMIDKEELRNKTNEVAETKEKLVEYTREKTYSDYIKKLLSDNGVKNYIIKKILSFWNKKVNFYLKELNSDFSIIFDENLDAVIKSRNRDPLQYHSFSGGEKARIDVAILCSVLDLSKLQNSIDLNLMVIDELLDSALDSGGREDVLRLLRNKALNNNASIYVISHATDLPIELFDKEITLYKKNGFTSI